MTSYITIKYTLLTCDSIQLGKLTVDIATGKVSDAVEGEKNAEATTMGRKGAAIRASGMTSDRREKIARNVTVKR